MQKIKRNLNIAIVMLLIPLGQACVSSSEIVKTGPDTYMISRSEKGFRGASSCVKAAALAEADKWCQKQGKVMKVISSSQKDMVPFTSDAYAEIHFKALDPNDPELKQPTDTGPLKNRVFRGDENNQSYSVDIQMSKTGSDKTDRYTEILKLGELREKGLITEEEFEREKVKLLESQ